MKNICTSLIAGAVGCAFIQPASALETAKAKEKVLYSFCSQQNCTDGETPYASLIDVKGTLYGTTAFGGTHGAGTVFALDAATGSENVLYSFSEGNPTSSLIDVKGALYGTTYTGGAYGNGTVFSLDPDTGVATVVHSFGGSDDGSNPYTGLIRANGTLYGTTEFGGAHGAGTVFALHPKTGTEKVLYSFCSKQWKCADGANPYASLIDVNGTLYGTTEYGGSHGKGTVFALNPNTGAETVLYTFCSRRKCADGQIPSVSLVAVSGTLYGTTEYGGSGIDGYGYGTVFALDPNTGTETVLYSFCSQQKCADGEIPEAALFAVNGTLFGTTWAGGGDGGGTVFSFDPKAGVETVLHAFSSGGDGQNPGATLIDVNGTLYGTTFAGGAYGDGTVFAVKRP
jgi:uncharacterized repeat protein (TIGR03803 family)